MDDALQTHLDEIRLRGAVRAGGVALALSCLAPQGVIEGQHLWLFTLWSDLSPLRCFAALLAPLCGVFLVVASAWVAEAATLAVVTTGVISLLVVMTWLSAVLDVDAAVLGFTHRSVPFVASVSLSIAALHAPDHPDVVPVRRVPWVALLLALVHGLFGWPDEAPWLAMARLGRYLVSPPHLGAIASAIPLALVALWPVWAALFAWRWVTARRPPLPLLTLEVCLGGPSLLAPLAIRALLGQGQPNDLAVSLGEVLHLGGVMVMGSHAFAALLSGAARSSPRPFGDLDLRRARVGLLPLSGILVVAVLLGFPAGAVRSWDLGIASEPATRLFSTLLPAWNDQRAQVDLKGGNASPVSTSDLLATAHLVDNEIEDRLRALESQASGGSLTLRRWTRQIDGLNERIRKKSLPFYIDPTQMIGDRSDATRRWYRLDTYRITETHRFIGADHPLLALHLVALTPERSRRGLLGLSRDSQRFAIVLADDIASHAAELERVAHKVPARCVERNQGSPATEAAVVRCGALLASASSAGDLGHDLLAAVERHELQHQIDGARLREATIVTRRFSRLDDELRRQLNRELSAHLAEMSAAGSAPSITLARALRLALLPDQGTERPVAYLMLEALSGDDASGSADRVAQAFLALASRDDDALRELAIATWNTQFRGELPALRRVEP
jgi:hypothetical protein